MRSTRRAAQMTCQLSPARARAVAAPLHELAPVTTAVLIMALLSSPAEHAKAPSAGGFSGLRSVSADKNLDTRVS